MIRQECSNGAASTTTKIMMELGLFLTIHGTLELEERALNLRLGFLLTVTIGEVVLRTQLVIGATTVLLVRERIAMSSIEFTMSSTNIISALIVTGTASSSSAMRGTQFMVQAPAGMSTATTFAESTSVICGTQLVRTTLATGNGSSKIAKEARAMMIGLMKMSTSKISNLRALRKSKRTR